MKKEIPAKIVYEDDEILAFHDVSPKAPIHILLIPKKPIPTMNATQNEDVSLLGKLLHQASLIAKELGCAENGYRLVINTNEDGGQSVFHLHVHLLAGRPLAWPPG